MQTYAGLTFWLLKRKIFLTSSLKRQERERERAEEFERVGTHTNNCFGKWKIKLINFHTLTYSCNMGLN